MAETEPAKDAEKQAEEEATSAVEVPAASQIQSAAKWLIGAFGAVAAIVAANIQFGDIGKVEGSDLFLAIVGALVAFLGIGVSIYVIARLLVPAARSINDLAASTTKDPAVEWLNSNDDVLGAFGSLQELKNARDEDLKRYREVFAAWRKAPDADNTKKLQAVAVLQKPTDETASRVVSWANYQSLHFAFNRSLVRWVLPSVLFAAGGLIIFAVMVSKDRPDRVVANLEGRRLAGADLSNADLGAANLKKADLSAADLTNSNLTETDLRDADLTRADLSGATLKGAKLDNAILEGVLWNKTTCPDGTKSSDAGDTCQAHLRISDEPE